MGGNQIIVRVYAVGRCDLPHLSHVRTQEEDDLWAEDTAGKGTGFSPQFKSQHPQGSLGL